jgi:hypothetical protein
MYANLHHMYWLILCMLADILLVFMHSEGEYLILGCNRPLHVNRIEDALIFHQV